MEVENPGIFKLKCCVKNYDWGKIGRDSSVAQLYSKNSGEEADDFKPYAEFWMGTHESGPSYAVVTPVTVAQGENEVASSGNSLNLVNLKDWIEQNPSVIGDKVLQKWGHSLPFLFKVLSVAKALSIQAHPDKVLAEVLHKQHPDIYKDDNHKPEMALGLTEFEALCGFISPEELKLVVHNVPEIVEVVGSARADQVLHIRQEDGEEKSKEVLRSIFSDLMSAKKVVISEAISKLISRLNVKREVRELTDKEELVLRLEKEYPGDVGVLAAFLLNYIKLKSGEALYLGANEPHAYLYGECIECMAASDNVVRAGLTPKNRDVQTLCSMLTYKQGLPQVLKGVALNAYTVKYIPPFDEFEVDRCFLPQGASTVFPVVPGPSIFLVMAGEGKIRTVSHEESVAEGDVLFACANIEITAATTSGLHLYRAGVNSRFFGESNIKLA
ncbi:mannose-6-phosphate isomerase 1-like [Olea europaea subsp. europaea]|uniref:mannose-6-phosphate isomerase n=1 Tax=Olea europaea subsp. europaea TaxID=158383 RepID=A0A8S0PD16_OLEEU|nr:mannose-6-phosphate isomerase 1-like [Olea europaea subsp. europaea]